jgi:transposase
LNRWKKQALEAMPEIFAGKFTRNDKEAQAEKDRLYQQIGKLQVELDWLKKAQGIFCR